MGAEAPIEMDDMGRFVVHSDRVLVVVLIDSTEDSRYDSLGGPLLLEYRSSRCLANALTPATVDDDGDADEPVILAGIDLLLES